MVGFLLVIQLASKAFPYARPFIYLTRIRWQIRSISIASSSGKNVIIQFVRQENICFWQWRKDEITRSWRHILQARCVNGITGNLLTYISVKSYKYWSKFCRDVRSKRNGSIFGEHRVDVRVKCGCSRSSRSWDIRSAHFVSTRWLTSSDYRTYENRCDTTSAFRLK